ncbi:MAG: carbohydrate ABC transporter permease [Chloroflexi bacterium]|nr:MAG: carbohydrate ABC transporter permease [Chloroflexota bacterium]
MNYVLRTRLQKRVGNFFSYLIMILVAITVLVPFAGLLLTSIKQDSEYIVWPIILFPEIPQWINYVNAFLLIPLSRVAVRTAVLGIVVSILVTFSSSLVGFAFARYKVKGSRFLFFLVVSLMIIPVIVILIPQFIIYSYLHLTNSYWPWIFNAIAGNSFFIFLFRQFFLSFPKELEDAAEVDGASPFRIYWQIFLPNAKPVIAAVMVFAFQGVWSDYFMPLILLNDDKTLLSVKLASGYVNPQGFSLTTISMAANVMYIIPLVILFFLAQKHIIRGVVTSGLKG